MPSTDSTRAVGVASIAGAALALAVSLPPLVGVAAGQPTDPRPPFGGGVGLGLRFVGGVVVNLLLGGALLALAPDYSRRTLSSIRSDTGEAVVWGLIAAIAVPIAIVVLAITVIGLIVAIPAAIVMAVVGLVGWAVTVLLVGSAATGGDSGDLGGAELLIGAAVLGLVGAIPAIGGLITWLVGLPGLGAVTLDCYRSWKN